MWTSWVRCLSVLLAIAACGPTEAVAGRDHDADALQPGASDATDAAPTELADGAANCTCGDGTCVATGGCGETVATCPADCATCGDKICSPGEGPKNCAPDCCGGCGDGLCKGYECGENPDKCPADCGSACGNGTCDKGEAPATCAADCKHQVCGNGVCEPEDGGPKDCPSDCATACGNCVCDKGESWVDCPVDCGFCGDDVCSPCAGLGESPQICPVDCMPGLCKTASECDDGNPCTTDSCVPGQGCQSKPGNNGGACGDGKACTVGACSAGACVTKPLVCSGNAVCVEPDGCQCAHDYVKLDVDGALFCAADYPFWGIRPDSPPADWFESNGDGTASDIQSQLMWLMADSGANVNWSDANNYCANSVAAGKTDWRLPTVAELQTLLDYSVIMPAVAKAFANSTASGDCWTANAVVGVADSAWQVGMDKGAAYFAAVTATARARCVRGIAAMPPPAQRFVVNAVGGLVRDTVTDLLWQRDSSAGGVKTWPDAKAYCASLDATWRLPTLAELRSLVDRSAYAPALAPNLFTALPVGEIGYWSSTPFVGTTGGAWFVDFYKGYNYFDGNSTHRVRCVRNGGP